MAEEQPNAHVKSAEVVVVVETDIKPGEGHVGAGAMVIK